MLTHVNQCESPCHIQIGACDVCANNAIFTFTIVCLFCGRVGGGGMGPRDGTKINKNRRRGPWDIKFGNY